MLLNKTALARDALRAGPNAGLGMLERRVLILTDGKRTLNEVMALLGADVLPVIDRLLREGYISDASKPPSPTQASSGMAGALTGLLRATTEAVQARTEAVRANNARPPAQPSDATRWRAEAAPPAMQTKLPVPARTAGGQRRSLVAAKMYMVDMLQLQRHPDAVELKTRIQCCTDQEALLGLLLQGASTLQVLTSESFGQRIVARLREVLPEECLPMIDGSDSTSASQPDTSAPRIRLVGS